MVCGVAALMLSVDPTLEPDEIRTILEGAAAETGGYGYDPVTGLSLELGHGRLNAGAALQQVINPTIPTTVQLNSQTIGTGQTAAHLATDTIRLLVGGSLTVQNGGGLHLKAGQRILLEGPVLIEEGAAFSALIEESLQCIDR